MALPGIFWLRAFHFVKVSWYNDSASSCKSVFTIFAFGDCPKGSEESLVDEKTHFEASISLPSRPCRSGQGLAPPCPHPLAPRCPHPISILPNPHLEFPLQTPCWAPAGAGWVFLRGWGNLFSLYCIHFLYPNELSISFNVLVCYKLTAPHRRSHVDNRTPVTSEGASYWRRMSSKLLWLVSL